MAAAPGRENQSCGNDAQELTHSRGVFIPEVMLKYFVKRLLFSILTIVGVVSVVFFLQRLTGDPAILLLPSELATSDEIDKLREALGLNKPLLIQYLNFLAGLLRGDMGYSYKQSAPAMMIALSRMPATFRLAVASMVLATVVGIPSGVVAAVNRNKFIDKAVMSFALLGQAMPVYWTGILLIIIFSVQLRWFPAFSDGSLRSMVLPSVTLGLFTAARVARITRSSMLEVIRMDFVKTARGKGLKKRNVIMKHALSNALIPIVTVLGMEFGNLMGGSVICETVFAWPGVGRLAVEGILSRDYPIVQAVVLIVCSIVVFINLGVDLLYGALDPRVKVEGVEE